MPTVENQHPLRVIGISGSLRKGSFNAAALHAAKELLPQGMEMEIADISGLPLFNFDLMANGFPEIVEQFREKIRNADAVLIVSPEYNYSIPGTLKNAIDWASRPPNQSFVDKPVAIAGVSTGLFGTVRMQQHLRLVLFGLNAWVVNKPEVYIGGAAQKFDANGNLTDETARKFLSDLLVALGDWAKRLGKA